MTAIYGDKLIHHMLVFIGKAPCHDCTPIMTDDAEPVPPCKETNVQKKTRLADGSRSKKRLINSCIIKGPPILLKQKCKYLGITVTSNLTWFCHIKKICSSARRKIRVTEAHPQKPSPRTKRAFNTIIWPCLECTSEVWDPHTKKNIDQLKRVQILAVRFICNRSRQSHSPKELIIDNKITTLESRRNLARLKFLFHLSRKNSVIDVFPRSHAFFFASYYRIPFLQIHSYLGTTNTFKYSFFPRTITDRKRRPHHIFESGNV